MVNQRDVTRQSVGVDSDTRDSDTRVSPVGGLGKK